MQKTIGKLQHALEFEIKRNIKRHGNNSAVIAISEIHTRGSTSKT